MFVGLPDPDPLVGIRILLSSSKNSKKNHDLYFFVTSFGLLFFKNDVNVSSKKVISRKTFFLN
jgi:hypothetical protein